jgi:preprotein translocase subunit YajC
MLKYGLMTGMLLTFLAVLSGCVPPEGAGEGKGFDWTPIVLIVLLVAIFYFLIIRPQRQKRHQQLMQELKRGDKVITTGGLYGVVESLSDDSVVLKVESGATIRVARNSVAGQRPEQ